MNDVEEWEIVSSPPIFKLKSKLSNYYCKSRYIIKVLQHIYNNGMNSIKMINQLVWINYSLYPYLPPKLSFTISIVVVCIFIMNMKVK
jgi:hypothetical protein